MAVAPPNSDFASIDIGSHTIRLLIARLESDQNITPLRLERRITRLARNFQSGGTLKETRMRDSIQVLEEYAKLLDRYRVCSVNCGATGVIRRAGNREDFLQRVHEATGLSVSILSEESEACLSAKGMLSVLPSPEGFILSFDLGGSTTELLLIDSHRSEPVWVSSVFAGAATLTEQYLYGDPPNRADVIRARKAIRDMLSPVLAKIEAHLDAEKASSFPFQLVGTAGTVTTLAAMHLRMTAYDPYRVNGLQLTKDWLSDTIALLSGLPLDARRNLAGLEKGREDIILGGALIVHEIVEGLQQEWITVTDAGLLEGLLLDLIEKRLGYFPSFLSPLTWNIQKG